MYSAFVLLPSTWRHRCAPGARHVRRRGKACISFRGQRRRGREAPSAPASRRATARASRWWSDGASTVGFVCLVFAHSQPWEIQLASATLGAGTGFAFSSMVNLVIESVPMDQTGVATGMNILMRTIGGTVGTQVAATACWRRSRHGLTTAARIRDRPFAIDAAMLALATVAALAAPGDRRRRVARPIALSPCTTLTEKAT